MPPAIRYVIEANDKSRKGFASFERQAQKSWKSQQEFFRKNNLFTKYPDTAGGKLAKNIREFTSAFSGRELDLIGNSWGGAGRNIGMMATAAGEGVAAVSGVAAAMAAATLVAWKFAEPFARGSTDIRRTAQLLGMSTKDLQGFRGAAQLNAISVDAMTSSLGQLNGVLYSAKTGDKQDALNMLNQLGLKMRLTKTGAVDTKNALMDLADAISKRSGRPQAQRQIADEFGLTPILPLLLGGRSSLQKAYDQALTDTEIFDPNELEKLDQFNRDTIRLSAEWTKLKANLAENVVIPWLTPALGHLNAAFQDANEGRPATAVKELAEAFPRGSGPHFMVDMWRFGKGLPGNVGKFLKSQGASAQTDATARAFFKSRGYSDNAIDGILGGMYAESGLYYRAANPSSGAYGLAQWLSRDRLEDFKKLKGHGLAQSTIGEQLDFVDWELRNSHRSAGDAIRAAKTSTDALFAYVNQYERPAPGYETKRDLAVGEKYIQSHVNVNVELHGLPSGMGASVRTTNLRSGLKAGSPMTGN